jgi:hypothetical protein
MNRSDVIFKRCGCRDATGRRLNKNCPRLAERGHGTWTFHDDREGFGDDLFAGQGAATVLVAGRRDEPQRAGASIRHGWLLSPRHVHLR